MSSLTQSPAWTALARHRDILAGTHLRELFRTDAARAATLSLDAAGLFLDYSKQRVTAETIDLLCALARQAGVEPWRDRMFAGEAVNNTENRAAMHMALRGADGDFPARFAQPVKAALAGMRSFCDAARAGGLRGASGRPVKTVINIGIGGSDLGPRLLVRALRACADAPFGVRFVANSDPADFSAQTADLDPAETFFIVTSKTFGTAETIANARAARDWLAASGLDASAHFAAVTANTAATAEFGVPAERCFPMWDWVGGRYSVWSAVGLPLALAVGMGRFAELLAGARDMDRHFCGAPLEGNAPVLLALLGIWNANFLGAATQAVLPYSEDLRDLPAYMQQLEMESLGKHVDRDGLAVDYDTVPVIWGMAGSNGQHAFHQMLHQGTHLVPCDFLLAASGPDSPQRHAMLEANALAQAAALAFGETGSAPHLDFRGNQPSNMLLLPDLGPRALGALLALYEHKVFVQSVVWNLNPFDQWGVELGKRLASGLAQDAAPTGTDASTRQLLGRLRRTG